MYEDVRVVHALNNVYKQHGKSDLHRGSNNDPDSCNTLELCARRRALRNLPISDRTIVSDAIDSLRQKAGIGTDAALAVLMRLGIFLLECEGKRMR